MIEMNLKPWKMVSRSSLGSQTPNVFCALDNDGEKLGRNLVCDGIAKFAPSSMFNALETRVVRNAEVTNVHEEIREVAIGIEEV